MANDYEIAMKVLNDTDKNRLVCLYINSEPTGVNWEKATKEFGAASVKSMKVMTRSAIKKIEDAGGKEGVEAKTGTASPKKRKAGDEGDDAEAKPKKKRGRKPKSDTEKVEDEGAADGKGRVKVEEDELE